ncbi:3-hydroxyacyl-CoA dehydrogenase family protein [Terrimonas pollutisoli]|uniref:3-hydroxyacyl-CoA dehydrogenase family protein n=1 Tax=Terrimonas pollutisoli TaxID=3034147 RepID=UPI0023EB3E45|nr:3-hydroxyacyl-CoA dehydrogenase family protein [Terrimonas sp. H1YJ31]
MQVLLVASESLKDELLNNTTILPAITWITQPGEEDNTKYDTCIDLNFDNTPARIDWLTRLQSPLVVINSVITPLQQIQTNFIRINGWNTFLQRPIIEAATISENNKLIAEELFLLFGKKTQWVPDITGLITPRVVAAIVNEAFFALQENVSTREEIDIAMKLGTNYPFGPFEWSEKIGLENIYALLTELSRSNKRYFPADLLKQTVLN